MPRLDQKNLWIGQPTHTRLVEIRARLERDKGRTVTFSEVIEWLCEREETRQS